jgi:two-component system, cell cycle response regulator
LGTLGNPVKILIADDSIVSRHLLEATLRKWGYEVMVACDGAEALQILEREDAPALIILDWMMPGMTGLEVCQKIRQRGTEPYIYILLLTSKSQKEDLIEGMDAGADDYITKPFDQNELQVRLRAGTRLVDLQAQLLSAREALREQATRDSLTHLWNRSSILDALSRELARSEREATPLGVVIVDLDHFKCVNDNHGHPAGDAVLREAARRMHNSVRQYDSIGRYGGEEFLILLPNCSEAESYSQAERMRKQLTQTDIRISDGTSLRITASFGVTAAIPDQAWTSEGLIRKADEALYVAKKSGRNRVEILAYSSEPAPVAVPVETAVVT